MREVQQAAPVGAQDNSPAPRGSEPRIGVAERATVRKAGKTHRELRVGSEQEALRGGSRRD